MGDQKSNSKESRILLVEDDFVNGKIVSRLLEMDNISVDWVKNGKEALEFYQNNKDTIIMVLMDLQMPVIDGYQTARKLREDGFHRPIIAMTANAFTDDDQKSIDAGMDDFLIKPVTKVDLFMMIEKWMQVKEK